MLSTSHGMERMARSVQALTFSNFNVEMFLCVASSHNPISNYITIC